MVSIPQAVSTVATIKIWGTSLSTGSVSIPQAVSTVATHKTGVYDPLKETVSIPQAVSTVATAGPKNPVFMRFQKVVLENLKP